MTTTIPEELDKLTRNLGEVVDRFVTVQFCTSGGPSVYSDSPVVEKLYNAARSKARAPLTYAAARALAERVPAEGRVIFTTGFIVPPYLRLEGDGPIGTPSLARAIALGLKANSVVVTEPANVPPLKRMMAASGLQVAPLEQTLEVPHKASVLPFPIDEAAAKEAAERTLDEVQPSAVIAVEKPSRNAQGRYHNGMPVDVTDVAAKVDHLVDAARRRGILTIGFGDGGNEIGMANISDVIKATVPNGELLCAATPTDELVVAASAGWGAYGVETCLAALTQTPHALHDEEIERRLLDASAEAGILDPLSGTAEGWLDGVPPQVNYAIVRILNYLLEVRLRNWMIALYKEWGGRKEVSEALLRKFGPELNRG